MAKSKTPTIIIISIVALLLVGGGIFAFTSFSKKGTVGDTQATSDDGSASLTATFYDANGIPISPGVIQSFLDGNAPQVSFLSFNLMIQALPGNDATLTNLALVPSGTDGGLAENLVKDSLLLTQLAPTDTTFQLFVSTKKACTGEPDTINCDATEQCVSGFCLIDLSNYESANVGIANLVEFSTQFSGDFNDARGQAQTTTSGTVALTYDIRGEACTDGTPYLGCVGAGTATPQQCIENPPGSATQPVLVDNAELCGAGCPAGYTLIGTGVGSTCQLDTCTDIDSTPVGQCTSNPSGQLTSPLFDENNRFCATVNSPLTEDCTGGDGVINANDCGCALGLNGETGTCNAVTRVCDYTTTAGLTGSIEQG